MVTSRNRLQHYLLHIEREGNRAPKCHRALLLPQTLPSTHGNTNASILVCTNGFACLSEPCPEEPGAILHPVIVCLLVDHCSSSPHIISRMARTCKTYAKAFPYSANMLRVGDWLAGLDYDNHALNRQQVWEAKQELSLRVLRTSFKPCLEEGRHSWELQMLSRQPLKQLKPPSCHHQQTFSHTFFHTGVAHLHPRSLSLWITSEDSQSRGGLGVHLDIFHRIHSVEGLKACITAHLAHHQPCFSSTKPSLKLRTEFPGIQHQHWFCKSYHILLKKLQPHWNDGPDKLHSFLAQHFALALTPCATQSQCPASYYSS